MPAMPGPSAIAIAFRYLVFGVLIAVMLVKPTLTFATEIGELAGPVAALAHEHAGASAGDSAAPDSADPDGCGDARWHLSHCCALQAALLPRFEVGLLAPSAAGPVPAVSTAFVPTPTAVPFRPPISA
ncbi:hypothetical protein GLA29479_3958 [Lysobacter antibioticus]|jgi:hypothetical protein|nr:hypothetical protein GLA29479_3958 [Lysobacter antibioticus]